MILWRTNIFIEQITEYRQAGGGYEARFRTSASVKPDQHTDCKFTTWNTPRGKLANLAMLEIHNFIVRYPNIIMQKYFIFGILI